ncbi:hypothetical protein CCHL11_03595 [Colletotrichum chlorophyti]|uniref:Uncharacterized protein n=1 Tax=Colletotrichum chlorophyti TaxID=708187 RepID=A0A1Q8RSI7_9PEZI|nr:hypothetical protein CCHL11_03595 [Colletotrichum chlorophyti]
MSRALDKHVIAALKQGDHEKIFNDIAGLFVRQNHDRLLEFEILGRSHPIGPSQNFLRDENAVAVPKLRLVQAFFFARQILQNHIADGAVEAERLLSATGVLLLMDPEHLTAANIRKRLLRDRISTGGDTTVFLTWEKCGESVWWFLRTAASRTAMGQAGLEEFMRVEEHLEAASVKESADLKVLKSARKWCELYRPRGDGHFPGASE